MDNINKKKRTNLDSEIYKKLMKMIKELKEINPFVRINPSKLNSLIIESYSQSYFQKNKQRLVSKCLDTQDFLIHLVKNEEKDQTPQEVVKKIALRLKGDVKEPLNSTSTEL